MLIIKTITWRLLATCITFFIAYILTEKIHIASKISLLEAAFKMVAYYAHERLWYVQNTSKPR